MYAIMHGVPWIHLFPALIALVVTFLYLKTKMIYLKILLGILWLLLIPNTAYIFIDVERITLHWNSLDMVMRIMVIIQYFFLEIIGLVIYLLAMLPIESIIHNRHFSRNYQIVAIILFNFLIGFGMVLGRIGYTNFYVIFTQPLKIFATAFHIITSLDLVGLTIAFGLLCNCIYFLFRNRLLHKTKKIL
jgi:uncharacterized membrane protein